jgi:hypothetical protein
MEVAVPQDGQMAAVSGISLPHRSQMVMLLYPTFAIFQ